MHVTHVCTQKRKRSLMLASTLDLENLKKKGLYMGCSMQPVICRNTFTNLHDLGKIVRVWRDFQTFCNPSEKELRPDRKEEIGNAAGLSSPNTLSAGEEPGGRPGTRLFTGYKTGGSKSFWDGRAPPPTSAPPSLSRKAPQRRHLSWLQAAGRSHRGIEIKRYKETEIQRYTVQRYRTPTYVVVRIPHCWTDILVLAIE
jgi:hypothetical protein